jgi:hypothetical protein
MQPGLGSKVGSVGALQVSLEKREREGCRFGNAGRCVNSHAT